MSKFTESVLSIIRSIPQGYVASYGQIALLAGIPRAALQVGWILHNNGETTPWWRVINNKGRISTSCEEHTALMQKALLEKEGIPVTEKLNIDINKYRWQPDLTTIKSLDLDERYLQDLMDKYF